MLSRPQQRFRHVVFLDTLRGVRACDLAPSLGSSVFSRAFNPVRPHDAGASAPAMLSPPEPRAVLMLEPEEEYFVRWLFRRAGLDARHYRPETLRRRLEACLRAIRAGSVADARTLLARHPDSLRPALASVLIGVTSFFRDPQVFHALAEHVLPQLGAARATTSASSAFDAPRQPIDASPPIKVWSVGCSDGQELYSIAMILHEQRRLTGGYLLGTDCREDAIGVAKAGVYTDEAMRSLPATRLGRYFDPLSRQRWRVRDQLRAACRWRCVDAISTAEAGRWDLILCRNMAMYLQPSSADALWASLEASLAPGGALVLGKAERPTNTRRLTLIAPCIYRKTGA